MTKLISVTYTCRGKEQQLYKNSQGGITQHAALSLDSQENGPILHWASAPHKLLIAGPDAEAIALGDQFILTLERK